MANNILNVEKRSLALISWAERLLGFGVLTCWRSYFLIIPDLHPWISPVVSGRFGSIKQLSFQDVHYTQTLISLKFEYNRQKVCTCSNPFMWMHIKFASVFCAGRPDALSAQGQRRDFPPVQMKGRRTLPFTLYLERAKPVPPITWSITGRWPKGGRQGRTSSRCWAALAASQPVAPWEPLLAQKPLLCIVSHQSGLSHKRLENRGIYFFLIMNVLVISL